ncbi:MAG: MFS transporter, partial [Solirubrobacteraceae bacterium]
VLESGALINALGSGFVTPFAVIYLHNVRGFALGESAAIVAVISIVGVVSGPLAGTASDRFSARAVLAVSLALMAAGFAGFPFVRGAGGGGVELGFALAIVAGAGNGSFYPSQSTLIGGLVSAEQRHVGFSLVRMMANLGYGIGGLLGGFVATTSDPGSFDILFFVDAGTFLGYIGVLWFVPDPPPAPDRPAHEPPGSGSYRDVLRDRAFVRLLAINAALIAGGYSLFETLVPAYAKNQAAVPEKLIGAFFLINTAVIVVCQMPITRLIEGRRRMRALSLAGVAWALGAMIVLAGGTALSGAAAGAAMMLAYLVFSLGECLQSAVVSPTAADLSRPRLMGRYLALVSFTWQLGLGVGPAAGGYVLQAYSPAVWILGAAVSLAGAAGALALEPRLPDAIRLTPRSGHLPGPGPLGPAGDALAAQSE